MAQLDTRYAQTGAGGRTAVAADEGLRSYMLGVYNYMAAGVGLTGLIAYALNMLATTSDPTAAVGTLRNGVMLTDLGALLYTSPLRWVVMLAPLAVVIFMGVRSHRMSVAATQATFWVYAALVGASLSFIFSIYTGASITRVFFVTAGAFAGLSAWGYMTKRDLTGWGSFLIMGLIGVIIAAIVNIFLASSAMQFAISVMGVVIFAGLTAYDNQRIKDDYYAYAGDATAAAKASVFGALALYQDFIGLFVNLLSLFGNQE